VVVKPSLQRHLNAFLKGILGYPLPACLAGKAIH